MRIGIDLDTTLIKLPCIDIASEELGYKFKEQDNLDWNFSIFPENLRQRVYQMFSDPEIMCDKITPLEGSQNKIKEWKEAGHEIILITARVSEIRPKTIEMVNHFYPEIENINFVGFNESKLNLMLELELDIWTDDSATGVLDSLNLGIKTYMISNKYTKYNWHLRDRVEWFKAVKDISL